MAKTFTKYPRIRYVVLDAAGAELGEVVAINEHQAVERAEATYPEGARPLSVKKYGEVAESTG